MIQRVMCMLLIIFSCHQPVYGQTQYSGISLLNPTGSAAISTQGLVVAYDFETYTNFGLLQDFGPYANHGMVLRTEEVEGDFGKARVFTELADRIDLPEDSSFDLEGPLSIAVHLKLSTANLHQHIFTCDDKYVLWTTPTNQYRLADTLGHGITTRVDSAQTGTWHSVIAVLSTTQGNPLDEDNVEIFIDGKKQPASLGAAWEPGELRLTGACLIGATLQGDSNHQALQFEGQIDELLLFSRALTDIEIQVFANANK